MVVCCTHNKLVSLVLYKVSLTPHSKLGLSGFIGLVISEGMLVQASLPPL